MKPNKSLRLMFIALAIMLIVAFTTLEITRIVEYAKDVKSTGLSDFEREFQPFMFLVFFDIILSPSIWLSLLFLWLAHKFKVKKTRE
ncbi:MAG: hypothetical protein HWN66_18915 [Candidatus Helarchaeota archaeon]|nr:hypothetical protein [Candidatus Helarchaeota archaeon]